MPITPQVNFNFKNENVQASVPLTGVSHFLARTTKGPFNDPSTLISSYSQFQRIFGEEVVPDGTVSNIRKALEIGSKVRVARVAGGTASYGYAGTSSGGSVTVTTFSMALTSAADDSSTVIFTFKIRSKEQGSKFNDTYDNLYLKFIADTSGPKTRIILNQGADSAVASVLAANTIIAWNPTSKEIDYQSLLDFVNQAPNVDIEVVSFNGVTTYDIYGVIAWMADHPEYLPATSFVTSTVYTLDKGSDGGDSTADTWEEAYDAISEYNDAYNLFLSHVAQHLPSGYTAIYQAIAAKVIAAQEVKLMVELPKPTTGTDIATYLAALKTLVGTIGQSEYICYFGGGIKYYDDLGVIRNCDVSGTVAGLHDVCAATYGPWISPAGQNRGIVANALGPVMQNLGTPHMKPTLQEFADWYMNLFVIKDTQYQGKRTMLWHNFTSCPQNISNKFQTIVNLNLYIKKNLRPILERYLEEPNTFATWKNMYYEVKPILDDLVTREAMTSYEWLGDQDVQSYADLQINNEADVRAGKYKVKLKYRDIVTLQEITLDIIIAAAEGAITIVTE